MIDFVIEYWLYISVLVVVAITISITIKYSISYKKNSNVAKGGSTAIQHNGDGDINN